MTPRNRARSIFQAHMAVYMHMATHWDGGKLVWLPQHNLNLPPKRARATVSLQRPNAFQLHIRMLVIGNIARPAQCKGITDALPLHDQGAVNSTVAISPDFSLRPTTRRAPCQHTLADGPAQVGQRRHVVHLRCATQAANPTYRDRRSCAPFDMHSVTDNITWPRACLHAARTRRLGIALMDFEINAGNHQVGSGLPPPISEPTGTALDKTMQRPIRSNDSPQTRSHRTCS